MSPPEVAALASRLLTLERQHKAHESTLSKVLAAIGELKAHIDKQHAAYCDEVMGLRGYWDSKLKKGKTK